jgi:hypothetical protein
MTRGDGDDEPATRGDGDDGPATRGVGDPEESVTLLRAEGGFAWVENGAWESALESCWSKKALITASRLSLWGDVVLAGGGDVIVAVGVDED